MQGLLFHTRKALEEGQEGKLAPAPTGFQEGQFWASPGAAILSEIESGQARSWLQHPANSMVPGAAKKKELNNPPFAST